MCNFAFLFKGIVFINHTNFPQKFQKFSGSFSVNLDILSFFDDFFRPPGVFEFDSFCHGTKAMMDAVVEATANGATSIIGIYLNDFFLKNAENC